MKRSGIFIIIGIVIFAVGILSVFNWQTRAFFARIIYDITHENPAVNTTSEIDAVLNDFEKVAYKHLEETYVVQTKSDIPKYKNMLRDRKYIILPNTHFYKKIVGDFRIMDFVGKDKIFRNCVLGKQPTMFWLIDKKLLYKILELQNELDRQGYNKNGFRVSYGHRHPQLNEAVNGAGKSKHIQGIAVDIVIGDVNNDGGFTQEDKSIVLEILEKKVIKNKGGIGRYPGTKTVHFDTRGYKARWDSY